MAVLGWILLGLLGVVLGACLILVATPLHIAFEAKAGAEQRVTFDLRTLWGLSPRLRVFDSQRPSAPKRDKPKPDKKEKKKKKAGRGVSLPGGREAGWRLVKALPEAVHDELSRIHIDQVNLATRFGTGDPADTGRIYGLLSPLAFALPPGRFSLVLYPDFNTRRFEAEGAARLHFTPVSLTVPAIKLLWRTYVRPT